MIDRQKQFKIINALPAKGDMDFTDCIVTFNEISTIQFFNAETEELVLSMQPDELELIYDAYRGMKMRICLGEGYKKQENE